MYEKRGAASMAIPGPLSQKGLLAPGMIPVQNRIPRTNLAVLFQRSNRWMADSPGWSALELFKVSWAVLMPRPLFGYKRVR